MGMTKNYILKVLENCSEHDFGQQAIEWAIGTGRVQLTGDLQTDLRAIMGEPGQPPEKYDEIIEAYRQAIDQVNAAAMAALTNSGLLEEINRPRSLARAA